MFLQRFFRTLLQTTSLNLLENLQSSRLPRITLQQKLGYKLGMNLGRSNSTRTDTGKFFTRINAGNFAQLHGVKANLHLSFRISNSCTQLQNLCDLTHCQPPKARQTEFTKTVNSPACTIHECPGARPLNLCINNQTRTHAAYCRALLHAMPRCILRIASIA